MTAPTTAPRVDLSDLAGLFDRYARILLRYTALRAVSNQLESEDLGQRAADRVDAERSMRRVGRGSVFEGNQGYQATWMQSIVDGL